MARISIMSDKKSTADSLAGRLGYLEKDQISVVELSGIEIRMDDILKKTKDEKPDTILILSERTFQIGYAIIGAIKSDEDLKQVPVIVLSNPAHDASIRIEALTNGADIIFNWPGNAHELTAQIAAMLKIKEQHARLSREKALLEEMVQEKTEALIERTQDLSKRVKELDCFYGMSELRERPGMTLEEILQGVADLIPASWQHPEIVCARILLGYQEIKTPNFRETPFKQSCDILIHGEWAGRLDVYYLEKPEDEAGLFLEEEMSLLKAICERLGKIAERVRAEDALRLESNNIISILKSMEDWVYKINEQYILEYINPALQQEWGPLTGKKCYEYFNYHVPCPDCQIEPVLSGKTIRREWYLPDIKRTYDVVETPLINPDGSLSKLSIMRDLTSLKQAQKALQEKESLYRNIIESAADGAVMIQEGRILFANQAFADMFGYAKPEELQNKEAVELLENEFREFFKKVFDPDEHGEDLENLIRGECVSKQGRKFWVSTNRRIIHFKSKSAILATMRDITEDMLQEKSIQEVTEHFRQENLKLKSSIKERYRFGDIVGKSRLMQEVYELIIQAASSDANVVILGESGTGKELVARAIYRLSERSKKPFVPVNCGAIPEHLAENEFFGHRKGAYTGAYINKTGYLHTADGGILFLDEVAELNLNIQVKLLRALESGEYMPVGETHVLRSSFRVIAATNRDLKTLTKQGKIREDFYYRMNVIPLALPPLREKKEDIPLLIEHFLKLCNVDKKMIRIPGKTMELFFKYDWPGNVRELFSVIQRYLAVGHLDFLLEDQSMDRMEDDVEPDRGYQTMDLKQATEEFERRLILDVLQKNQWHRGKVAAALKIDPKTLYMKIKKIGICEPKTG